VNRLARAIDTWVIPLVLVLTWVMLFASSNVRGIPAVITLFAFGLVVVMFRAYRELRIHAASARHAAQGDPDELLALAERELSRRWTPRSRAPFHIFRSIAYQLRGEWAEARKALDAADLKSVGNRARRSWSMLHDAQRINLLAEEGDAAGARRVLEQELLPMLRFVPGAGSKVIADEAEARVLLAERRFDAALPTFDKLARDVRLGPATRALCRYRAAQCLDEVEPAAAREVYLDAARIAPKTWIPAAVRRRQAPPTPG
jgi:hypothetical protein